MAILTELLPISCRESLKIWSWVGKNGLDEVPILLHIQKFGINVFNCTEVHFYYFQTLCTETYQFIIFPISQSKICFVFWIGNNTKLNLMFDSQCTRSVHFCPPMDGFPQDRPWGHQSFLWDCWCPFWNSDDVCPGFQSQGGSPSWMLCDLNMDSSDSLLVWHLLRLLAASKAA